MIEDVNLNIMSVTEVDSAMGKITDLHSDPELTHQVPDSVPSLVALMPRCAPSMAEQVPVFNLQRALTGQQKTPSLKCFNTVTTAEKSKIISATFSKEKLYLAIASVFQFSFENLLTKLGHAKQETAKTYSRFSTFILISLFNC